MKTYIHDYYTINDNLEMRLFSKHIKAESWEHAEILIKHGKIIGELIEEIPFKRDENDR